jgi:hypothetical protein
MPVISTQAILTQTTEALLFCGLVIEIFEGQAIRNEDIYSADHFAPRWFWEGAFYPGFDAPPVAGP